MLKYLTKYWRGYLIGSICLIIVNVLAAYIPQLIKNAVDILSQFQEFNQEEIIVDTIKWILILALIMAGVRIVSRQVIFSIGREIEFDLKKEIFDHLIKFEPEFFTQQRTGDLISIITNDVQALRGLGGFAMLNVANTLIAFAVVLPLMFKLHVNLTWAFLALIPLVVIFVIGLSDRIKRYQTAVQERLGEISNFIEQNLSGIHIVKAYAQEEAEVKRFHEYNSRLKSDYINLVGVRSLIGPVMRVIASLGFLLLLYIGGKALINQNFSPGDFAAYSLYIQRLIWPVATLGWLITIVYRAQVSHKRISAILDSPAKIKDRVGAIDKKDFSDAVELKELGAKISKAQNVAIVGTIASGKSTLANKLMHLKELNDGEILIDAKDVKDISLNSLRHLVNLVPQESFLFSTSVSENIAYACDLEQEKIEELCKLVKIHEELVNLPDGYETIVGERGVTLSGGQRQRLAIARAMALCPEILILDDALSSLDDDTAAQILQGILDKRKGKTTIFITHKIQVIKDFDQILVMDKMKIVEQGKHDDLIKEKGVYSELYSKGVSSEN